MASVTVRLRYRVLTGPDDAEFCRRVSEALDEGYELHGSPALTYDGTRTVVAQAVVLPPYAAASFRPSAISANPIVDQAPVSPSAPVASSTQAPSSSAASSSSTAPAAEASPPPRRPQPRPTDTTPPKHAAGS
ncbi:hypothetical protein GCM10009765_04750 [Fodinicola feengrottensis]|uniref:DUF1737 domain-containing protein n=1 Tax=Fodinicola feengrottensis TaxID=435914 RepID=A0ABN2FSJ9_9ACTN